MNQEITVIGQYPFGLFIAFQADREFTAFFQLPSNLVTDRLDLRSVRAGGEHKEVREGTYPSQIEHDDVFGQLGFGSADRRKPRRFFG